MQCLFKEILAEPVLFPSPSFYFSRIKESCAKHDAHKILGWSWKQWRKLRGEGAYIRGSCCVCRINSEFVWNLYLQAEPSSWYVCGAKCHRFSLLLFICILLCHLGSGAISPGDLLLPLPHLFSYFITEIWNMTPGRIFENNKHAQYKCIFLIFDYILYAAKGLVDFFNKIWS